jgi:hypothetical protein
MRQALAESAQLRVNQCADRVVELKTALDDARLDLREAERALATARDGVRLAEDGR